MGSEITWPSYPDSFGIRRKLFYCPDEEINRFIKKSVMDIVLEKRIGLIDDEAIMETKIQKTEVKVWYKEPLFIVKIREKGKVYEASGHAFGHFPPITTLYGLYQEMKYR